MYKIFISLRHWLASLAEVERQPDALAGFTTIQLADLPTTHPQSESRVG